VRIIKVLDRRRLFEMGGPEQALEAAIITPRQLVIYQQGEAVFKAQLMRPRLRELLLECGRHAEEAKLA
jgi:hypothetical protein